MRLRSNMGYPTGQTRSRRPRPSPMWGSRIVGARAVGPWVGEQKPLRKTPLRGNPSPEMTYLPYLQAEPAHKHTRPNTSARFGGMKAKD